MKTSVNFYLLLITLTFYLSCEPSESENSKTIATGTSNPPKASVNNNQISVNIEKGLANLLQRGKQIEPNAAMVLHYLQRKFSLGKQYEFSNFFETYPITDVKGKALERMVNPNAVATVNELGTLAKGKTLLDNLSNTSYAMNCALMCDKIPLPPDFFTLIQQLTELDRYFLTHAALSLQWLGENDCLTNPKEAQMLQKRQHELLTKLIVSLGKPTDLQMEAIAILLYTGGRDFLEPEWINVISNRQLPDGGWPLGEMSSDKAHDHATVHALWALLEYKYPDAPATSWVMK